MSFYKGVYYCETGYEEPNGYLRTPTRGLYCRSRGVSSRGRGLSSYYGPSSSQSGYYTSQPAYNPNYSGSSRSSRTSGYQIEAQRRRVFLDSINIVIAASGDFLSSIKMFDRNNMAIYEPKQLVKRENQNRIAEFYMSKLRHATDIHEKGMKADSHDCLDSSMYDRITGLEKATRDFLVKYHTFLSELHKFASIEYFMLERHVCEFKIDNDKRREQLVEYLDFIHTEAKALRDTLN